MSELRAILKRVGVTSIYVTHDQQEAFAISDRVIIMRQGCVVQQGTPHDVYFQPASPWVARFLGLTNLVQGRIVAIEPGPHQETTTVVATSVGDLILRSREGFAAGQEVTVLIRPEAARLADEYPSQDACIVEGIVRVCSFRGSHCRLEVHHPADVDLVFELASDALRMPDPGEPISLALRPEAISLLAEGARDQEASA